MKTFGKILGATLLVILLLVVALAFAVSQLIDPNDYKEQIRQLARDKAHVELSLDGDIGWSLFPWLGLELHDAGVASLSQPDQPLARVEMLGVSVRVLPLLRRQIEMSDIRVNGLDLKLVRDAQGHGNWEDLGKPAPTAGRETPANSPQPTASSDEDAPREPLALNVDSIQLANSRVDFNDQRAGRRIRLSNLSLSTGEIREGASIPLTLASNYDLDQPTLNGQATLTGKLRFDTRSQRYQLEDAKLEGDAVGAPLSGKTMRYSAQGQLLVDRAGQVAEWNGLKLTFNQLQMLGELKVHDLEKAPKLEGALSVAPMHPRQFLDSIGVALPPMADSSTLGTLEFNSRITGTQTSLALEDLKLKLDDSTFSGRVAVDDFAKQALRVKLQGDRLDLDRYLPAKTREAQASNAARQEQVRQADQQAGQGSTPLPATPTQQAWSDSEILPVERLKTLDLALDLALGKLTINQLPIDNASLKARAQGGLAQLDELRGELFGGRFDAKGTLDVRGATPTLSVTQQIARAPVEQILQSQGQKPPVRGQLDLQADLQTRGNSQRAWIDGLNGTVGFTLLNGALLQANLESQLCRGIAFLNQKALENSHDSQDTPFQQLSGSLNIRNGVASNDDLRASIPGIGVKGNGAIDLRVLGMDYRVGVTLVGDTGPSADPGCAVNERYVGIEWPLQCRGPLELGAKACRLDQSEIGKIAAQRLGSRLEDKVNEKLEKKFGDKAPQIRDALKGLLNR